MVIWVFSRCWDPCFEGIPSRWRDRCGAASLFDLPPCLNSISLVWKQNARTGVSLKELGANCWGASMEMMKLYNLYYWVLEAWVGPVIFPLTNEIGKCVWRLWTCLLENSRLFFSHFFNCLGIKIKMGRRRKVPGEPCYAPTFGAACELALR